MGASIELFVADADAVELSLSLSLRKCVDCHLSHGLTQKEAGQCNNTCAPLVGYMDVVSGTAALTAILHTSFALFVDWRIRGMLINQITEYDAFKLCLIRLSGLLSSIFSLLFAI